MTFNVREVDLERLNSMTKYPSIPTYHTLDPKNGRLLDEVVDFGPDKHLVYATEKVDGTNARIILLPDGTYLLGSREELLYAQGDLIEQPQLHIVATIKPIADRIIDLCDPDRVLVIYGEVYGAGVGSNGRQYAQGKTTGFRVFDVASLANYRNVLSWDRSRIAGWRDNGGQAYLSTYGRDMLARSAKLELVPHLFTKYAGEMPKTHEEAVAMLTVHSMMTKAGLDNHGAAEGIVLRSDDRTKIAKIRWEDYKRTQKQLAAIRK